MFLCGVTLLSAGLAMASKSENSERTLESVMFYHVGNGEYQRTAPPGTNCQAGASLPCTIEYLDENDVIDIESFQYNEKPEGDINESNNGTWL